MLLQTNSYIVPKERRAEHARLIRRFRQALARIGCDQFDVYEQIGANWDSAGANGRYVQLMRFRDHEHQQQVQDAEREDTNAQAIIAEFCALINFPYQQQHGYFATGFYSSVMPVGPQVSDSGLPATPEVHSEAPVPPAPASFVPIPESSALGAEPTPATVPLSEMTALASSPIHEDEESDLLDLSSVELSDEEVTLHDELNSADEPDSAANHRESSPPSWQPGTTDRMLDAKLPEEDDFSELLDDSNMRAHAPLENGHPISDQDQPGRDEHHTHDPHANEADLLEFDAFLRELKDGSSDHG